MQPTVISKYGVERRFTVIIPTLGNSYNAKARVSVLCHVGNTRLMAAMTLTPAYLTLYNSVGGAIVKD